MKRGLLVSLSVLVIFSTVVPVFAASFDGTYNYAYNLNGPNGWEEHSVDGGFIVRGGVISSNPSAFSGTVDSSGNVRFSGPSPYGGSATFTGTISSTGNGEGTYVDGQGLRGSWAVSRTSGGGMDWFPMIYDAFYNFIYTFSFIGELIGLSGRMAAIIGTSITLATGIIVVTVAYASATASGAKSEEYSGMRRGEYHASQPGEPPRTQGAPPSTIGIPPPPPSPPIGITTPVQGLPDRLNLRSDWTDQRASLSWNELQYDRGRYELEGFEVTRLYFDGSSTSANRMIADRLGPDSRYWNGSFNQTYRWNTGGDIQGYRVDAIFKDIASSPPRYLRVGETSHAPYS